MRIASPFLVAAALFALVQTAPAQAPTPAPPTPMPEASPVPTATPAKSRRHKKALEEPTPAPATAAAPVAPAPASAPAPAAPTAVKEVRAQRTPPAVDPNATPAPGGGPGMVWVNTKSHVYHDTASRYYGKTKHGKYVSEKDALAEGDHAAPHNE